MQEHNKQGFMLKSDQGEVLVQSMFSAHSHKRVVRGSVTLAVPDAPGLFYRLTPLEARQLTDEQHAAIREHIKAWYQARVEAGQDAAAKLIEQMNSGGQQPKAEEPPAQPEAKPKKSKPDQSEKPTED